MTPLFRKFLGLHWILFVTMLALMAAGVYSIYAAVHFRDGDLAFLSGKWRDQINWAMVGSLVFFPAALIDYKWIRWGAFGMYAVGLGLLGALFRFGEGVHGQQIQLALPGIGQFQPAQVAIASTILLMAVVLAEGHKRFHWMQHYLMRFLVSGAVFLVPFGMITALGDIGSAMVMIPVAFVMMVVGSIPFRCLLAVLLLGVAMAPPVYYFALKPYQKDRITVPYDIMAGRKVDVKREGYATDTLLKAVGSSGWEGKGMDPAKQEENLPNLTLLGIVPQYTSHDDFIFTVVCETFGFRGAALMVGGFVFLLMLCLSVAFFARDALGRLVVAGVLALLFAHTFEHIGMNIGLLPITGIPLPLISYGGTFLVMNLFLFGLVQSVWVHRNAAIEARQAARSEARRRPMPGFA
jgi:rod shape determining protein RodA